MTAEDDLVPGGDRGAVDDGDRRQVVVGADVGDVAVVLFERSRLAVGEATVPPSHVESVPERSVKGDVGPEVDCRRWRIHAIALVERPHGVDGVGLGGASCRRGSAAPARTAAPCRRDSGSSPARRRTRSRRPARAAAGRRSRRSGRRRARGTAAVCQSSISSVMPLNVLPSMTKPPVSGSRAPRWMLDSLPRRRPEPHSTASTTRSRVCTGLTFSQPAPRRPASYGAVERLGHHALVAGGERARRGTPAPRRHRR